MQRSIFIALAALAAGVAAAQEAQRPDPTDPRAKVPGVEYRSAFADYRPFSEEKVAPWRESNEAVKGSPGHEGHAAPPAEKAAPAAKPRPAEKPSAGEQHGGHR